jgi:hypothetical protein
MAKRITWLVISHTIGLYLGSVTYAQAQPTHHATTTGNALRIASYVTAHQVEKLATDSNERTRAEEVIRRMRIAKLYIEVYRSGLVVPPEHLVAVRNWAQAQGLAVVGGIATVPGGDFGVRQQGPLGWFNWQHPKTQQDLAKVIRMAAGVFDTFIVDDFLCTGDVSDLSKAAKGERSWGEYRRALLTELAQSVFIQPAREMNPHITLIVKYPQWYDRFHLFGYDTATLPRLFDQVWVGTETRGRSTQRFGFVQPYEGFVNYRWLADIAGEKIGGAWFDHGDCGEYDFLDQAYMSVLAGARELVLFNFNNLLAGHPDHPRLIAQFDRLGRLSAFVQQHPVIGIPAYKPPNSEPGGDMYIMDFLGMLGIPIIPVSTFPEHAPVVFLPTQAAADPDLFGHIIRARQRGVDLVVTTGLLLALPHGNELATMLGINAPLQSQPVRATLMQVSSQSPSLQKTDVVVDLEAPLEAANSPEDIVCSVSEKQVILLQVSKRPTLGRMALLNTHTFNQADFDAVGEVLLCPRRLGLLDLPETTLSLLRQAFRGKNRMKPGIPGFAGPSGVTFHPLAGDTTSFVVQNFNAQPVDVVITSNRDPATSTQFCDAFANQPIRTSISEGREVLTLRIPARDRVWIQSAE